MAIILGQPPEQSRLFFAPFLWHSNDLIHYDPWRLRIRDQIQITACVLFMNMYASSLTVVGSITLFISKTADSEWYWQCVLRLFLRPLGNLQRNHTISKGIPFCTVCILTVAWELTWTLQGSTATPPRWAIMLVLFLVVNMDRLPNELSTALELVSGNGKQRRLNSW